MWNEASERKVECKPKLKRSVRFLAATTDGGGNVSGQGGRLRLPGAGSSGSEIGSGTGECIGPRSDTVPIRQGFHGVSSQAMFTAIVLSTPTSVTI